MGWDHTLAQHHQSCVGTNLCRVAVQRSTLSGALALRAVSILYSSSTHGQLFRFCVPRQVLRLLVKLYEEAAEPDWASICQCLMFLDDGPEVAKIFDRLLRGSEVTAHDL